MLKSKEDKEDILATVLEFDRVLGLNLNNIKDYSVVIADEQTKGKGRLGRYFFSPKGTGIYMSYSLRYFLFISIPAVFGLSALAKPLLGIFTTEDFLSGWLVIPVIAFSGLMTGVVQIFINTLLIVKKTKAQTYINIVAAVSNVLINLLLIPSIGIVGAALSTLLSYFFMAILCTHMSLKYFKHEFYFHDIAKSILSSVAMYLFVSYFEISSIHEIFEVAGIGVLIYLFGMFLLGGFNDLELSLIKRYLFGIKKNLVKIIGV